MIITCPDCSARYKINESKIKGKGAKITCPRCSHRFVVMRDNQSDKTPRPGFPPNLAELDFSETGVVWKARRGLGITLEFNDLSTLNRLLSDGQLTKRDEISYDYLRWHRIDSIADLRQFFWETYQKAKRGEIASPSLPDEFDDDEDLSEAPTTIMRDAATLAQQIQQAVFDETPRPTPRRMEHRVTQEHFQNEHAPVFAQDEAQGHAHTPAPAPLRPAVNYPPPAQSADAPTARGSTRKRNPTAAPAVREPPPPTPKGSEFVPELPAVPEEIDLAVEHRRMAAFDPSLAVPAPPTAATPTKSGGRGPLIGVAIGVLLVIVIIALAFQSMGQTTTPAPPPAVEPKPAVNRPETPPLTIPPVQEEVTPDPLPELPADEIDPEEAPPEPDPAPPPPDLPLAEPEEPE
jgi:predicted Zn finger-like uncharacterized protein